MNKLKTNTDVNLKTNIQELLNDSFIDDCKNVGAG